MILTVISHTATNYLLQVSDTLGCNIQFKWYQIEFMNFMKSLTRIFNYFFTNILLLILASCSKNGDSTQIQLSAMGSFSAGGITISNGSNLSLSCDHGHVEYLIPKKPRKVSLFMWHSSSVSVWQNRWDGGEGFQTIFLRRGYPIYLWDGPGVGRANWGCESHSYSPSFMDQGNFIAWRFGKSPGEWFPGIQFPIEDKEALNQAMRGRYLEFDTLDNALLQSNAASKAFDRIGPTVALTNSAGGWRALMTRLKSDNVVGIVAYETPGLIFPIENGYITDKDSPFGPYVVPLDEFNRLTEIPIQLVFGDNTQDTQWEPRLERARNFARIINENGGDAEVLVLPEVGLYGNTHIPMMDLNNIEVADLLSEWLKRKGLDVYP